MLWHFHFLENHLLSTYMSFDTALLSKIEIVIINWPVETSTSRN